MLIVLVAGLIHAQEPVVFNDAMLQATVEKALGVSDPTPTDMLGLLSLENSRFEGLAGGIADLTGLEYAHNLQTLWLREHDIVDISVVTGMPNLTVVNLSRNEISDLSPLENLTQLQHLDLHGNNISDLSSLSNLTNINTLILRYNDLSDISPIENLTLLTELDLLTNSINDISSLASLTQLQTIRIGDNFIQDISALGALTHLQFLQIHTNQIEDLTPLSQLENVENLILYQNWISDVSPLTKLRNLRHLDLTFNGSSLNSSAYCSDLQTILDNNYNLYLHYDYHLNPTHQVVASDGAWPNHVHLTWTPLCNGPLYETVYQVWRAQANAPETTRIPISPCQTDVHFDDTNAQPGVQYRYWIETCRETGQHATVFSDPDIGWTSDQPQLEVSAGPGGHIISPNVLIQSYPAGTLVPVEVVPSNTEAFIFAGWTGTAVTSGNVEHPLALSTSVLVDGDYTLKATFLSRFSTLFVDPSAIHDPGPYNANLSDPQEQGTRDHPFDSIQEAIEVAPMGATIHVQKGTYVENLSLHDKSIHLTGQDPQDPNHFMFPVLLSQRQDPTIQSIGNVGSTVVEGFVVTGGGAPQSPALVCQATQLVLKHCLIAGYTIHDPNRAIIDCKDSHIQFENCTITENTASIEGACLRLVNSAITIQNSILWNNRPTSIQSTEPAKIMIAYSLTPSTWIGTDTLHDNPLFVQPGQWLPLADDQIIWITGDYHLQSTAGHWEPVRQIWQQDSWTSPAIDMGDPQTPLGSETWPHGQRINLGIYGGTSEASLTPLQ